VEHVVFFPAPDGTPAFRRLASLDDAARFVEHLRNVENVSEASVHALTEVPLAFKAWYRVELPQDVEVATSVELPSHLEIPAPTTIAEAIESYSHESATLNGREVELPETTGSATGILVPERDFVAQDQFAFAPPVALVAEQRADLQPVDERAPAGGQILEPAFGGRRDRGIGYFAR
jgi:hypothetical protein